MLPSWTDRLHIFIGPQSVDLILYSRGLKPTELMRASQLCRKAESNEPVWIPAIEAFKKLMLEQQGKADAYVYFSSHFANYLRIPEQDGLATRDEEAAYIRFCFSEVFGSQSDNFIFSWSGDISIEPQISSAVDRNFLSAVDEILESTTVIVRSIQPNFMTGFNLLVKLMAKVSQWYVFVESGQIVIGYFLNGICMSLRKVRVSDRWRSELPSLLARELNALDMDLKHGNMLISAPENIELRSLELDGWNLHAVKLDQMLLIAGQYLPIGVLENSHASA